MDESSPSTGDAHALLLDLADMIGPVSHELLNVLNGVVLKAAVLGRAVPAELREQVAEFRTLGHRAGELLAELQRVRQQIRIARQPVDLNAVVEQVTGEQSGLKIEKRIAPDLPLVWGNQVDTRRLVQLLIRLAAGKQQGPITIATEPHGRGVRLHVRHAGPSVETEQLDAFFEPFGSATTGQNILERAVCQTIARRLGATLRAEGGPGLALVADFEAASPSTRPSQTG